MHNADPVFKSATQDFLNLSEENMNRIFWSLLAATLLILGLMLYGSTSRTSSTIFTPTELVEQTHGHDLPRVKVGGRVAQADIQYSSIPRLELKFSITEPADNPTHGQVLIPVVYYGVKPDMFDHGRDVIIEGAFEHGTLMASNLLTQCPSKYEPPTTYTGK